jgi:O-antigen ligase
MVLTLIALSFLGPALLGFRQIMSGTAQFYGGADLMRTFGTFVGPSAFGVYLVTILAIFVVQALTRTGRSRLWPLLIVVSAVVLLVQTFSRSAWVGAIVVILTIGLLKERRLLILLPLAIVVAYVWVPEIALRLQNPLGGTYLHRTEIWRGSYETWLTLTSPGGGFLPTLMDRLSGLGPGARYLLSYVSVGRTFGTHNDYLALLFDYGIMGLLFYLLMIFTLLFAAYRAWRQSRHDLTLGAVPLSFLALALAYMAMSAVDNIFGMTVNQVYFWSLAGLTVAVSGLSAGEGVPGPEHAGAMPGDNRGPADMISRASVRSSLLH